MAQDIISDALNQIMNAKRAAKSTVVITRYSGLLTKLLEMMKQKGYLDYEVNEGKMKITIKDIVECKAIKPRYTLGKADIDKYIRRFLPSRNVGFVIISTSKGLMLHNEAIENKIGGSLIAYFY
jgi:small subunit ribosomal protein S8